MITILFRMTVKAGRDSEWSELVSQLTRSTRSEDEGCVNYVYHRRLDNPREYVFYEQWRASAVRKRGSAWERSR
jgi:quinol monooxygenase YgiN